MGKGVRGDPGRLLREEKSRKANYQRVAESKRRA